jgi:hypothetical protein
VREIGRTVRLYLISTFGDVESERAALEQHVFPRLGDLCGRYRFRFQAVDLRRDLADESAFDQLAMQRALEESVEAGDTLTPPKFVVLLGDRFGDRLLPGEIPSGEFSQIEDLLGTDEARDHLHTGYRRDDNAVPPVYVLQTGQDPQLYRYLGSLLRRAAPHMKLPPDGHLKYVASTTEQELLRGALHTKSTADNTFSFCREIENLEECERELPANPEAKRYLDTDKTGGFDASAHDRLDAIRETLASRARRHHTYRARWTGSAVTDGHVGAVPATLDECLKEVNAENGTLCVDAWHSISRSIRKDLGKLEGAARLDAEVALHHRINRVHTARFRGREDVLKMVKGYLDQSFFRPLVIVGDPGSGRSALVAKSVRRTCGAFPTAQAVIRFLGATPDSLSLDALLRSLCQEVCRRYRHDPSVIPDSDAALPETFRGLLTLASHETPLFVFLDGLEIAVRRPTREGLAWIPEALPEYVGLVLTVSTEAKKLIPLLKARSVEENIVRVPPLASTESLEILSAWLDEIDRRLSPDQMKAALAHLPARPLPLHLGALFERTRRCRSYDDVASLDLDRAVRDDAAVVDDPPGTGSPREFDL